MRNKKTKKMLFSEFSSVTTKQWEEKIYEDLKGNDYEKKLVWPTMEGFNAYPYYRQEHLNDKQYLNTLPGEFPYTRGNNPQSNDWEIRQDIKLSNIEEANHKSLFVLERGITALGFILPTSENKSILSTQKDFSRLLKNIYFDCIGLYFVSGYRSPEILTLLQKEVEIKKIDKNHIYGAVDFDPLGYLTITGNYGIDEKSDFQLLGDMIERAEKNLPNYSVLGINGYFLHNAGASAVQELGYSLAMAAEYLTKLTDSGIPVDSVSHHLQFNFGVGSNYFMEIAKIRAARTLWANMVDAYNPTEEKSKQAYIHSVTSDWNQTVYDPYMNVLRATTESMAAVIGGTDSLTVRPFTFAYKPTNNFSGRVARNIQIILKEEVYLNKNIDPAAGSYYIEILTDSIIDEAWRIFLQVEIEGGYTKALKKGLVQTDIEKTARSRNQMIATRREVLLGTNQYPNAIEVMKDEVVNDIAFPKPASINCTIKPLKIYRGAMEFEKLRLAIEQHSYRPKVFLLTYGNLTMRKARAAFSSNFFACAGYEIIDNPGFESAEEGVKVALERKADIIVACSSDEEYVKLVPQVKDLAKDKALVVVAGSPACMEELKAKGIQHFVHMKSNVLESLQEFQKELGI